MENFVDEQSTERLLLDVQDVWTKHLSPTFLLVSPDATSNRLKISPCRILPGVAHEELVLDRMKGKANIAVVNNA